jgi:hypothetical protein
LLHKYNIAVEQLNILLHINAFKFCRKSKITPRLDYLKLDDAYYEVYWVARFLSILELLATIHKNQGIVADNIMLVHTGSRVL